MSLVTQIKSNPKLKQLVHWSITPSRNPRPRLWIRWFVNPFFHKRGKGAVIRRNTRMDVFPWNRFEMGALTTIESFALVNNGSGPVLLGDRVRIGVGSVVLGPVTMGNGSGLEQHESMNRIYPHSINTSRINTEYVNGQVNILHTLMRMGSGGEQVDNASSGGMYLKIDTETGELNEYAFMADRTRHTMHPDTGFVFKGAVIEQWPQIKKFAVEVALKFREMRYLGWDFALTPEGLVVIEVNHHPGFNIVQDCYGGARDDLKINPKEWWYQSNYTIKNV